MRKSAKDDLFTMKTTEISNKAFTLSHLSNRSELSYKQPFLYFIECTTQILKRSAIKHPGSKSSLKIFTYY